MVQAHFPACGGIKVRRIENHRCAPWVCVVAYISGDVPSKFAKHSNKPHGIEK